MRPVPKVILAKMGVKQSAKNWDADMTTQRQAVLDEPTDYPLLSPLELSRKARVEAQRGDYRVAADHYDQGANLADQWGDHAHADTLRESAETYRVRYHRAMREAT